MYICLIIKQLCLCAALHDDLVRLNLRKHFCISMMSETVNRLVTLIKEVLIVIIVGPFVLTQELTPLV